MPDKLITKILTESKSNIYDVFATLYLHCKGLFDDISRQISDPRVKNKIKRESISLQQNILPKLNSSREKLNEKIVQSLLSYLGNEPEGYTLRCFTVLDAIDRYYDNIYANCVFDSNYSTDADAIIPLNLDINLGYVYPKCQSPIVKIIQKAVIEWQNEGNEYFSIRPSNEISSYLMNLVFIKPPIGYSVILKQMDSSVWQRFPDLLESKIALVPFIKNFDQINIKEFPIINDIRPFVFTGLKDTEGALRYTKDLLQKLDGEGVTIVVFPELSIPEEITKEISSWLKEGFFTSIRMIFCGSFHYLINEKWFNVAHVLGPDGERLWKQNKCNPFTLMKYESVRIESLQNWADYDSQENIYTSPKTLVIYDTPLGRTIILICKDFLLSNPEHQQIIVDTGVNCAIVPTMTAELKSQFTLAANIYSTKAKLTTILANSCVSSREAQIYKWKQKNSGSKAGCKIDIGISFIYLPGFKPDTWLKCQTYEEKCPNKNCMKCKIFSFKDWVPSY